MSIPPNAGHQSARLVKKSPFAHRALLRGHPQLRPGRAPAFLAAARAVDRGGVPQVAGFAGRLARGEGVSIGGDKAGAGKLASGADEAGGHFGGAGEFASLNIAPTGDALLTGQRVRLAAVTVEGAGVAGGVAR